MSILRDSRRPVESIIPPPPPAWVVELGALLGRLGYHATARAAVVDFVNEEATGRGCESLEPDDVAAVDSLLDRAWSRDVPADEWPAWTDAHTYEPAPEDEVWYLTELDRREALDELAALESRATELHERGLDAFDSDDLFTGWTGGHPA